MGEVEFGELSEVMEVGGGGDEVVREVEVSEGREGQAFDGGQEVVVQVDDVEGGAEREEVLVGWGEGRDLCEAGMIEGEVG